MTDPEITTDLQPADRAEIAVDTIDDLERPAPLEADEADVAEQRLEVPLDDDGQDDDEPDADPGD